MCVCVCVCVFVTCVWCDLRFAGPHCVYLRLCSQGIGREALLFEVIFPKFRESGPTNEGIFLELLEPYILQDRLKVRCCLVMCSLRLLTRGVSFAVDQCGDNAGVCRALREARLAAARGAVYPALGRACT